jgi:hypothetical protein
MYRPADNLRLGARFLRYLLDSMPFFAAPLLLLPGRFGDAGHHRDGACVRRRIWQRDRLLVTGYHTTTR